MFPEIKPKTGHDWDHYRTVVDALAEVLIVLFEEAGQNYQRSSFGEWPHRSTRRLMDAARMVSRLTGVSANMVRNRVTHLAWKCDLLVRDADGRAMQGRTNIPRDEAREIVDEAVMEAG